MSRREARAVALRRAGELRLLPFEELKRRWLDQPDCQEVIGDSGRAYQVEVEAFWDDPRNHDGNLRVWVTAGDSIFPPVEGFIIAPDGSFIDE